MNNELGGHVRGPVLQAGSIGDVFVSAQSNTVNNVLKEVRSLNPAMTLYRILASLMVLASVAGVGSGRTPLQEIASVCDSMDVPSSWTGPVASWITERAELVGGVAALLITTGLLSLPKPRDVGWDLGQTLEWRAPSTTVLSFAVLVQCDYAWYAMSHIGLLMVWVIWETRRRRYDSSDRVVVAVGSILLAAIFAPLYLLVWFLARDVRGAPQIPGGS
ncbi:hypothetical protein [Streptomyces antarcticus]|uniref:hypothetical protein n=1 Tax=Streptomyces antarcticus TaxID=2996458 RepID=UPI0022719DAE|nr:MULTISPECIES: hypothetical protein [unclassified Streptomyces]MCY0946700.1 hypothetical protein [Streptomyces sp. H34-AA3]MCZ4085142.1 hypothetical protein [Streptomyces sp. H34-S5]